MQMRLVVDRLQPFRLFGDVIRLFARVDEHYRSRDLVEAINRDPIVTSRFMGIANSACFAPTTGLPITTVDRAINRIGIHDTQSILLAMIARSRFDTKKCKHFDTKRYWSDAMMLGHCTYKLALDQNHDECSMFRVAGITYSLGLLLATDQDPDVMLAIFESEQVGRTFTDIYDETYQQVSARLLAYWGVDETICMHILDTTEDSLLGIANNCLAHHFNGQPASPAVEALMTDTFVDYLDDRKAEVSNMAQLLDIE